MVHAAIGGMQLKRWSGYFRIIWPTLKVLNAAKRAPGCLHAETFKDGHVFFAVSVWQTQTQMQDFARTGLHGRLTAMAMTEMKLFYNHSRYFNDIPTRRQSVAAWKAAIAARNGKGTVGRYTP